MPTAPGAAVEGSASCRISVRALCHWRLLRVSENSKQWGRHSCLPRLDVLIETKNRMSEYRHPRQTGMSAPPVQRAASLIVGEMQFAASALVTVMTRADKP